MRRAIAATMVIAAALLGAAGCETTPSKKAPELPEPDLRSLEKPPEKVEGRVIAIPPPEELTDEQKRALRQLGIPLDGFVFPPEKARAAAELRVYAEDLYTDAAYNREVESIFRNDAVRRIMRLSERVDDRDTWWQRSKGQIGFAGGWLVGAGTAVLIVYGVSKTAK